MSHSRFTRMPRPLMAAVVVSFSAVAHAGPAETIFSAENALYGAGYDIGTADGWIDNTLRSAIREYQASQDGLQTTGNLDPKTLTALGIAAEDSGTITGNTVANPEAAMSALGISEQRYGLSSSPRTVAAAPEPEIQPEPQPIQTEEPEPASTLAEQAPIEAAQSEPAIERAPTAEAPSEPEPRIATEAESAPVDVAAVEEPVATEQSSIVEEPPAVEEPLTAEEPSVVEDVSAVEEPSVVLDVSADATEETSTDVSYQPSDEPLAPDNPEVASSQATQETIRTEPDTTAQSSSGGFFASLFDFLFGWLI